MADIGQNHRGELARCRRVIVKIGSKALADAATPRSGRNMFHHIAADIAAIRSAGQRSRRVVLVSSGAIAMGMTHLGMARRPRTMPALQAAAAAGQGLLMQRYSDAFQRHELRVAQVLLTHADLARRARANNARAALSKLLDLGVVPIINENDAVAVDEIRFGDNDELAAMVAPLCDADLLVLLSHVEGVLDERGERIGTMSRFDDVEALASDESSTVGRGGMKSKLEAARRATLAGAQVVIARAGKNQLTRSLAGNDIGTFCPARSKRLKPRKHWIAFTLRPRGVAVLDAGAAAAIQQKGGSILCVGVLGIRGDFVSGDPISLVNATGKELARGLARLSAMEAARLARTRGDNATLLVHRDDLVVLPT